MKNYFRVTVSVAILFFWSCSSSSEEEYVEIINDINPTDNEVLSNTLNLPTTVFDYNVSLPNHFLAGGTLDEDNTPNNNLVTNDGATLGRVLFYDKQLSANNTVSCASCHVQENGFTDPNTFSEGFNGGFTPRNSMGLANARFYDNGRFFWDERAASLEEQVLLPIQDEVEMGLTLDEMVTKLSDDDYYAVLFRRAFGDEDITSDRISRALSQFVRSMVSYQSKYDDGLAQTNDPRRPFSNYTQSENLGKNLFFSPATRCADCHHTNAFVGDSARNNGLDAILTDLGVGGVTNNNNQRGEFKVPSLRNIGLTGPFMHDGRFATLEEVVEHYNSGVQDSPELDDRLRVAGGNVRRLNLSNTEKQALVDFLLTLTDNNFVTDEKFSNPFL